MSHLVNITRIKAVYNALGPLRDQVVFVGGATVSLYADRVAEEVRPTDDVDVLVEISSRASYIQLEEQLRKMGFVNDAQAGFIGRYIHSGIVVDVMPTNKEILGFSNRWYEDGFRNAHNYEIDPQHIVRIFTPVHFIATKLEAFKTRGNNDGRLSSDFEDTVYVWINRRKIWDEMINSEPALLNYLKEECKELISTKYVEEWISGHAGNATGYVLEQLRKFLQ